MCVLSARSESTSVKLLNHHGHLWLLKGRFYIKIRMNISPITLNRGNVFDVTPAYSSSPLMLFCSLVSVCVLRLDSRACYLSDLTFTPEQWPTGGCQLSVRIALLDCHFTSVSHSPANQPAYAALDQ